ncbi:MAG TPA: hypothetical protein VG759_07955 [Candidatus Angelobacter sp.]|jgi:hypothetical protein|nr:hypothetical protein [Candidatus Angelobacter sp.]
MKPSQQARLLELVANPPPGSDIEAAKKYGVDLTLNIERLLLTPTERVREMEGALRLMEELQRAGRLVRRR